MLSKKKLRHNEYYNMEQIFDKLYSRSRNGNYFYNLIELMTTEENIRLAYRNIKNNTGSTTAGVDNLTILDIRKVAVDDVVRKIKSMFEWYQPQAVRRVYIPKPNGKKRPLGIPTIWDRIFQQCILQVLDPIMEAKFHNHSYGFRPNRSTHHAISRMNALINRYGLYHCIDVDIKGFFDNVNHGKLLKQMWTLGIREKKLLSIISRLLKAEIESEGIPTKGTPQGGILSPLLSNIVLNELDWWISDQWETFETKTNYKVNTTKNFYLKKKTNLKECYIVRYADDFKILCRNHETAVKVFYAVKSFLKERLRLEISEEKTKIINLRKKPSEFLGFKIKAVGKKKSQHGYVANSNMSDKAKQKAKTKIKEEIKRIQKNPCVKTVWNFNTVVMGIQNYYGIATHITEDLSEIDCHLRKVLYNRLRTLRTKAIFSELTPTLQKRYKGYNPKYYKIQDMVFVPIHAQRYKKVMNFSQDICDYTEIGRNKIHKNQKAINSMVLVKIMKNYIPNRSIEYNDNRISKYVAQYGKCAVTGIELGIYNWHCHHIKPISSGGYDNYQNLIIVSKEIHTIIHMKDMDKIINNPLIQKLKISQLEKLNKLRMECNRDIIKL